VGIKTTTLAALGFPSRHHSVYTVDYSQATYRWDLMLDDYVEGEYTAEQAQAVAELCYHVGVASMMGYREDASSTDNYYAILALQEHFGYASDGVNNVDRNKYDESQWMRMVAYWSLFKNFAQVYTK